MSILVRGEQLATVSPPPQPSSVVYNKGQLVQSTERGKGHIIMIESSFKRDFEFVVVGNKRRTVWNCFSVGGNESYDLKMESVRVVDHAAACLSVWSCLRSRSSRSAPATTPLGGRGRTGASDCEMRLLLAFEAGERTE